MHTYDNESPRVPGSTHLRRYARRPPAVNRPDGGAIEENVLTPGAHAEDWDLGWTTRINTKYRTVFDVPEIESGYGVWRASMWGFQYQQTLNIPPKDMTAVLVLRH